MNDLSKSGTDPNFTDILLHQVNSFLADISILQHLKISLCYSPIEYSRYCLFSIN